MKEAIFVSRYGRLAYTLRAAEEAFDSKGVKYVKHPKIKVQFQRWAIPLWAEEQALKHFKVTGLAEGESPRDFMGIFDVDQEIRENRLRAEDRDFVIERMLQLQDGDNWFLVEKPRTPVPFPAYDQTDPARLLAILSEGGYDLERALNYELENEARRDVIDKLKAKIAKQAEKPVEELIQA